MENDISQQELSYFRSGLVSGDIQTQVRDSSPALPPRATKNSEGCRRQKTDLRFSSPQSRCENTARPLLPISRLISLHLDCLRDFLGGHSVCTHRRAAGSQQMLLMGTAEHTLGKANCCLRSLFITSGGLPTNPLKEVCTLMPRRPLSLPPECREGDGKPAQKRGGGNADLGSWKQS